LQFDDTNLAYLCDPAMRAKTRARGDDPDDLTRLYCRLVNDSVAGRVGVDVSAFSDAPSATWKAEPPE
jgi:hypothetical protein